jgi:holo-[acyl-carrier protein] synthase
MNRSVVGIGIDAVDVARFRRVLDRRPRLVERVFTEAERADAAAGGDRVERLAARFAAKEATMKALGIGIGAIALRDVEVVRAGGRGTPLATHSDTTSSSPSGSRSGAPSLRLRAKAAERADRRRVESWQVSLTHTADVAMAVVLAEGELHPGSAPT